MTTTFLPRRFWGALLAPTVLLAGTAPAAPPKTSPAALASRVTASMTQVKHGGSAALSVSVTDKTLNAANAVVDLEVYDSRGKRVAQNVWQGQTLTKGKASAYHWTWKPAAPGAYTVKLGVFGAGWKPLYHWSDKALTLTVA